MIELATAIIVEGKCLVGSGLEIIAADAIPWSRLCIDCSELPIGVLEDPDRACARPVQRQVIELATAIVVEGKCLVGSGLEIIAADAIPWSPLCIDCSELPIGVLEDPDRTCPWPVQRQVIELATAIVVEGEDAIGGIRQVIAADAIPWSPLCIDCSELPIGVLEDPH